MSKPCDNDVIWTMREAVRAWLHDGMSEDEMIARIDRVLHGDDQHLTYIHTLNRALADGQPVKCAVLYSSNDAPYTVGMTGRFFAT